MFLLFARILVAGTYTRFGLLVPGKPSLTVACELISTDAGAATLNGIVDIVTWIRRAGILARLTDLLPEVVVIAVAGERKGTTSHAAVCYRIFLSIARIIGAGIHAFIEVFIPEELFKFVVDAHTGECKGVVSLAAVRHCVRDVVATVGNTRVDLTGSSIPHISRITVAAEFIGT